LNRFTRPRAILQNEKLQTRRLANDAGQGNFTVKKPFMEGERHGTRQGK
jgi:hypothetical protein